MAWTERYVRVDAAGSGDGTTDTNSGANGAFTLAEAITHSTTNTGVRYNVKAGVYANTTTTLTFSGAGTNTALNWWRGFKTTIGDMDGASVSHGTAFSGSEIPVITFTTGTANFSGAFQMVSNVDFDSANTAGNGTVGANGNAVTFYRVRARNTATTGTIRAIGSGSGGTVFNLVNCFAQITHTTGTAVRLGGIQSNFIASEATGGNQTINIDSNSQGIWFSLVRDSSSELIRVNSDRFVIGSSTISGSVTGIQLLTNNNGIVINNVVANCSTVGITSSANNARVRLFNNAYWNNADDLTNLFELQQFNNVSLAADPFTNAAGGDYSLVSGSLALAAGIPGRLTNGNTTGYLDIGAIQRECTGGGGGGASAYGFFG